ncbi:protein PIMREG isoform X4 [Geospiza fortis]|uniref:Protein PIMREG isoform X4 n=1 Tax=Geospiza fortis TaxID=48883 RepID=A0A8N5ER88_GEOFO|nr:protein PIMREG isoform X4 [Geospiza fortis]
MASVLQNVKATVAWRKHRLLADLNEDESPVPDKFKRRASLSSLNTIRMSLRKRKIQKSCQSPVRSMVTFPAESISRSCATSSTKKRTATPQTPCCKSVTPAVSSKGSPKSSKRALLGATRGSEHRERRDFSSWLGKNALSLRRSRRAAALKSPYSSPAPSSRKIEFDRELELVSSGICQLKRISQAFDDAIVKEERQQAISNYYYLMARNSQSVY